MAFANQPRDALGQNGSLAGPSAGDNQHRSMQVFDSFALAFVRLERGRGRYGLQYFH